MKMDCGLAERECGFKPGTECIEGSLTYNHGEFVKPCEICDIVVQYWDERRERDKIRRLKRIAEGAKY